jgi:hypothetical protein
MHSIAVMWFGGTALLLFSLIYFFFDRGRRPRAEGAGGQQRLSPVRPFNITFARLFGLMTVAVLGTALALSATDDKLASSAFTLLGTVAGYLAGAKATTPPAPSRTRARSAGPHRPRGTPVGGLSGRAVVSCVDDHLARGREPSAAWFKTRWPRRTQSRDRPGHPLEASPSR